MRAIRFGAGGVQRQGVILEFKAAFQGDLTLALLDFRVIELLDEAAVQAYQVIVMLAFVEFVNCLASFEMVARENARLLELRQNTVDRGQANISAFVQQNLENILG